MRIKLLCHASVLISTEDCVVMADPWFVGGAFNDSWSLWPAPAVSHEDMDATTHLYISHEHPDHFHFPTLKSLPAEFKSRVNVIFQYNNSNKVTDALKKLGFSKFTVVKHRHTVEISPKTQAYVYQQGLMNSGLGLISGGQKVFNINDAEFSHRDCQIISKDIGTWDVVLNQFSMAGYGGNPNRAATLTKAASRILGTMMENHRDLGAKATIPFASFIYFSTIYNSYMNEFGNKPRTVHQAFQGAGLTANILYPGDTWDLNQPDYDSESALSRFDQSETELQAVQLRVPTPIPLEAIESSFQKLAKHLKAHYGALLLSMLKPVVIRIPDINQTIRIHIRSASFERLDANQDPELEIDSDALNFAFSWPWGVQTLGVSARATVFKNIRNWKFHRAIFALNNAEIYTKGKQLFTSRNMEFFKTRFTGSVNQLFHQLKRMEG